MYAVLAELICTTYQRVKIRVNTSIEQWCGDLKFFADLQVQVINYSRVLASKNQFRKQSKLAYTVHCTSFYGCELWMINDRSPVCA